MINKTLFLSVITFLCFGMVNKIFSQNDTEFTLENAIYTALRQNNNIKIALNLNEISENNARPGAAGLLPTINANANIDYGNDNTKIELANSPIPIESTGAESSTYNASIALNYTIFSGFSNQLKYNQLKISSLLTQTQSQILIENIVMQVASSYYNLIRTEQNLNSIKETLEISYKRYEKAKIQNEISGGTSLNMLNSLVDLNKDSVDYYNSLQSYNNTLTSFNQLLGNALDSKYEISKEISFTEVFDYNSLRLKMLDQNSKLKEAKYNYQKALTDNKIAKSAFTPVLDLNTSYSYYKNEAEGGFMRYNQNNGAGVLLSLKMPIYNAGNRNASIKNTNLAIENTILKITEVNSSLERDLANAFEVYLNNKRIYEMEKNNLETAKLNFEYSKTKYDLGQIDNTQFRTAQLNLLVINNNLNNKMFNAKLAELELLRLSGLLVK